MFRVIFPKKDQSNGHREVFSIPPAMCHSPDPCSTVGCCAADNDHYVVLVVGQVCSLCVGQGLAFCLLLHNLHRIQFGLSVGGTKLMKSLII